MRSERGNTAVRCAIYTRVSTEHGLEQEFNSLDNQREASEAYIKSQAHEGWKLIRTRYDDGGYSGGSMERPAIQKLLDDVRAHRIDVIVVYKVDRLTRSLLLDAPGLCAASHDQTNHFWRAVEIAERVPHGPKLSQRERRPKNLV
jgi:predicted site-specific integrase-resolvase